MNHPPLHVQPNIKLEDNDYLCSDLRDGANYVNSFYVQFTLTTNLTKKHSNELVADIFSPIFPCAKEITVFFDAHSRLSPADFKANWSFRKDRMKAINPTQCQDDFSRLWFNAKVAFIMSKDDFMSSEFFSQCNDPSVILNPRTAYGKEMWNYARYRVDKHDFIALCTDHHNTSNQSNVALSRPRISIVARGSNLNALLSDAFKYCSITNHYSIKNGKLFYLRSGRIKLNESHFRKQGRDLLEGYDEVIVKRLRTVLSDKGLLINIYTWPGCIKFDYRPETWDEYLGVIKRELKELKVPESTRIIDNSHPAVTNEYKVYAE